MGILILIIGVLAGHAQDKRDAPARSIAIDAGDAGLGEVVFKKCRGCHQVGDGAKNRSGPILNGIVGNMAATVDGFKYSQAFKALGDKELVWTPDNLDAFLKHPRGFAAKTKMSFPGLKDESDRLNVIAFLAKNGSAEVLEGATNTDLPPVESEQTTLSLPDETTKAAKPKQPDTERGDARERQQSDLKDGAPTWVDIQQLFVKYNCMECHSDEDAPFGLKLDTYENTLAGGENGPVAVSGKPGESTLLQRLGNQADLRMPLTGPPFMSDAEIGLVENWIIAGLPVGDPVETAPPVPVQPRPGPGDPVTYGHVRSIFLKRCVECHKENGKLGEPPEGLKLGSYEDILAGGERLALVPGNPGLSEILRRVEGFGSPRMPMDGPPWLDEADTSVLRQWIAQGARNLEGTAAPMPVGGRVRFRGLMTGRSSIDGADFVLHRGTRIDKSPRAGHEIEVRGTVAPNGEVIADRLRRR